ncbi:hypothetical protein Q762_11165 [Flavobacterium cauense R2A-7]|nr:hypothetical protein Q762_11165 [Flavobacterium cauense R2A-7]
MKISMMSGFMDLLNGFSVNKSVIAVNSNRFPISQSNPKVHNVFFVGFRAKLRLLFDLFIIFN